MLNRSLTLQSIKMIYFFYLELHSCIKQDICEPIFTSDVNIQISKVGIQRERDIE